MADDLLLGCFWTCLLNENHRSGRLANEMYPRANVASIPPVIRNNTIVGCHIRHNIVKRSGQAGILFRPERGQGFTGDRNTVERNVIIDTGAENAAAIDVQGTTAGLLFRKNEMKETRAPAKRVGFRLGSETKGIVLESDSVEDFAAEVDDKRKQK